MIFDHYGAGKLLGNVVVNAVLLTVLFGLYLWTPWASFIVASLSSFAFIFALFFDQVNTEQLTREFADRLSVIAGLVISIAGVAISMFALIE